MNHFKYRARLIRTRRHKSFSHVYYQEESEDESFHFAFRKSESSIPCSGYNVVNQLDYVQKYGVQYPYIIRNIGLRRMIENRLFTEYLLPLPTNKVFCSVWQNNDLILMGTKCNKIVVYNVKTCCLRQVPTLRNSPQKVYKPGAASGIHSIAINPSKTMMVAGGPHSNEVAVYALPYFKPVCVGENGHSDWIFDLKWIDNEFFVSGCRDGRIALWNVNIAQSYRNPDGYYYIEPVIVKNCQLADKVRAIGCSNHSTLAALSSNAYLHHWDLERFQQLSSHKLPYSRETLSLAHSEEYNLFAIGSASNITFVDSSSFAIIHRIRTRFRESSVRSLCFCGGILSIGTGFGTINFYDINAGKYFDYYHAARTEEVTDENISNLLNNSYNQTAIYTHSYDQTGSCLFTAGGPWAMNCRGSYAALWL